MTNPLGSSGNGPFGPKPIVGSMFRSLAISASGLSAQRERLEVISQNIANAETTHTDAGGPYKRKTVQLEATSVDPSNFQSQLQSMNALGMDTSAIPFISAPSMPALPGSPDDVENGVRVSGVGEDASQGPLVYEPGHPDADKNGYVRYPNVRITDEMVDMMDARRVYEANATVFQSAKAMLKKAIDI